MFGILSQNHFWIILLDHFPVFGLSIKVCGYHVRWKIEYDGSIVEIFLALMTENNM